MVGYYPKIYFGNNATAATISGGGTAVVEWVQVDNQGALRGMCSGGDYLWHDYGCTEGNTVTMKVRYPFGTTNAEWPIAWCDNAIQTLAAEYDMGTDNATLCRTYRMGWAVANQVLVFADGTAPKVEIPEIPLSERMRKIIAARMAPAYIKDLRSLNVPVDIREIRARQTLHRVIGDDKFRNFLKKGFITVRAKSGKFYQIFPGHGITRVYFNGQMVERLCVVLTGDFPPTDSVIMRYLLILNNEEQFRSLVVKHDVLTPNRYTVMLRTPDGRPLVEIFNQLKKRAA